MLNPNVIRSDNGKAVPLSDIAVTGDIAACPANIAALCMCIAELVKERQLWLEPSEQMILSGMAELNQLLNDMYNNGSNLEELTDDQLSDTVVFVLQAMASKR
ncbi:MAG: hypothetical protein [Caudoviricetes sp.]|nr:MAG: hypothetical protein [Caudoviricetes sp.]